MAPAATAKNFRWSSQGDASTLDPHGQNESFTNGMNGLVYEYLVARGKDYSIGPALATSWKNTSPTTWVFTLRKGVRFHDGSPLTVEDVIFSFERAKFASGTFKLYANQTGVARKVDEHTIEFTTPIPNPVMLETVNSIYIMSKKWCEKNNVVKPQDFANKEETFAVRNAMGTGPYKLVTFEPGVKTLHVKNKDWWGVRDKFYEGNVETVEYRPITNPVTRMAAVKSGEVDFVLDPPVQDVPRMREDSALKVWEGGEIRVIMLGFDQERDELLYSDVKGKNPFKDVRVRKALYQALDVNAIKTQVMRGLSVPTGLALMDPKGAGVPAAMEKRLPYDPAAAKKLLAEAGYPNGFSFTMHCPNDRYVNDEKICVAAAGMWARIGVNAKIETMSKTLYFPKILKRDASAFMSGWGGGSSDAMFILKPCLHSRNTMGAGDANYGNFKNDEVDRLIDAAEGEMDAAKRQDMINRAVQIVQDEVLVIPLHRQVIPWVSRKGVTVVHRPNNILWLPWVKVP
ncbi:ABC transporter substrate-binding protein [Usitatibacter palustris]|uniref:ABC transporter substrate-binding protein n=1 Tax=Usitatibacter palustris TaxID=2732487 RepID=UPI001BB1C734|nr:ABC transporter substrate-binding protein [Usitatibacter palustris]